MGPGRAGPGRLRPALPVRGANPRPKHDPVCEIPMSQAVGPTRPPRFNVTRCLIGQAREILTIFSLSSVCFSCCSRSRGRSMLIGPRPAESVGWRSLPTIGVRSRVCHAPIPAFDSVVGCRVGYVVPLSGVFQASINVTNRVFFFLY